MQMVMGNVVITWEDYEPKTVMIHSELTGVWNNEVTCKRSCTSDVHLLRRAGRYITMLALLAVYQYWCTLVINLALDFRIIITVLHSDL